jgi:exopolysaccharide biosynthesis polyprenyl glycosylphosphotransferase
VRAPLGIDEVSVAIDASTRVRAIQRSWSRLRICLVGLADLIAVLFAVGVALDSPLRSSRLSGPVVVGSGSSALRYEHVGLAFAVAWIILLCLIGGYGRRCGTLWNQCASLVRAAIGLFAVLGTSSLFLQLQLSRAFVVTGVVSVMAFSLTGRLLIIGLFAMLNRIGIGVERVLLIGDPTEADVLRNQLSTTAKHTTRVVDTMAWTSQAVPEGVSAVVRRARRFGVTSVVVCGPATLPAGVARSLGSALSMSGISVVVTPGSPEALGPGAQLHPIGDLFLLKIRDPQPAVLDRMLKALFDRIAAFVVLLVLSPALVLIATLVRRETPGPALFRQKRIGRGGTHFTIYKFRSMAPDAEQRLRRDGLWDTYVQNGFKLPEGQDPRITRLGAFLRRTSLDELPQLLNVALGSMSLVGPRPIVPEELASYGDLTGVYTGVKPGVTGYWQVNGRSDILFPERAYLDAYYYDHRSMRVDLRILLRTVVAVARRVGAH